jgi:DNA-binding NarL/FixJ family response regulator
METYDVMRLTFVRELRQNILRLLESGLLVREIAKELKVSQKTVYRHLFAMGIKTPERKRKE